MPTTVASRYATSFPVLSHDVVTQGHADYCAEHGHATHTVDEVVSPFCPRCGQRLPDIKVGDVVRFPHSRHVYVVESIAAGIVEARYGGLYRSGPVESLQLVGRGEAVPDVAARLADDTDEPTEAEIAEHEDEVQRSIAEHEVSLLAEETVNDEQLSDVGDAISRVSDFLQAWGAASNIPRTVMSLGVIRDGEPVDVDLTVDDIRALIGAAAR
jgi:hypothetical protein